ncbi:ABC transporter substrate-binding protein [Cereibacter changlensis]|nr:extracellular solute-binding protein [Cereibacter changlensis]
MTPFLKAFGVAALTATATLPQLAAAQDLPGPLVLYTNDFEGVITERFEADTGRQIDVVQMSGGELLARIAAETANPQWDVLIFNGSYSLHALDAQGQLKRDLEPANLGALNETGQGFLPESRGWFPIGLTASCVMAYRPDLVETPPATFADLADPRFNGAFGMADPAVAAPAYPCVAQFFHSMGQEGAEALFTQYFDNGLRVFRTNGPVGRALSAGEISLALITSQVAYSLKAAGEVPVEVIWPAEGAPGAVRGVAAQAATGRPDAARAFVDWLLTAETQAYLQEAAGPDGLFEPTVTGGPRRADGPAEGAVYRVAPDDFAVAEEAAIKSWFADRALQ